MENIIVTGGAGYIGSHACKMLKKAGYRPITYDNLSVGHKKAVKWGPLVEKDLKDKKALDETFEKYKPLAVMHFAAYALVGESITNPLMYYENNVYSTICLLEAMEKHNVGNIIFSSTCATYGTPKSLPITENTPQIPINPYGQSKLLVEKILEDLAKVNRNFNFAALRYFNAAGADFDGEIGENHKNETHLIPLILKAARKENGSITVFGTDYNTPDGSAIRDYIHVVDLIDAHIKALEYIVKNKTSLKLNLGSGAGYSVLEIIENVKNIIRIDFDLSYGKKREGDPPVLFADISKAKKELGWSPIFSDLKSIISSAWQWEQILL